MSQSTASTRNSPLPESGWFTINYPYASKVISDVHTNYKNYKGRGEKQGKENSKNFSLKKMDEIFDTMLEKYVPKFNIAEKVELKLPKLQKKGTTTPNIQLPKLKKLGDKKKIGEPTNV